MSLLSIRNLTVSFATSRGPFKAVDGVDLDVAPGELVAIVGESGSGKSVAMLAVMGAISIVVYDRFGTALLRKAWLNLDWLWAAAFVVAGVVTFFT